MKKLLSIIICISLCLSLFACANSDDKPAMSGTSDITVTEPPMTTTETTTTTTEATTTEATTTTTEATTTEATTTTTEATTTTVTTTEATTVTTTEATTVTTTEATTVTTTEATVVEEEKAEPDFESSFEAVSNMGIGWNIGNSLDSYGWWIDMDDPYGVETGWGQPRITRELIHLAKVSGIGTVRIPITYLQKMDEDGNVDKAYLKRINEVVDYVLDEGMYCIINVHHDTGGGDEAWLRADEEMFADGMAQRYAHLWKQIAEHFKDYGDKLMFESFNEILDKNSNWGGSTGDNYAVVNKLNQIFVDTVRATGGNNEQRNIIVLPYGASSADSQISGFVLPSDTAKDHIIVECHIYDPGSFCSGDDVTWDIHDEQKISSIFERLNKKVIEKYGVPMIIGEFAAHGKDESDAWNTERAKYVEFFVKTAKKYNISCIWWDDGGGMRLFDRNEIKVYNAKVLEALVNASK